MAQVGRELGDVVGVPVGEQALHPAVAVVADGQEQGAALISEGEGLGAAVLMRGQTLLVGVAVETSECSASASADTRLGAATRWNNIG